MKRVLPALLTAFVLGAVPYAAQAEPFLGAVVQRADALGPLLRERLGIAGEVRIESEPLRHAAVLRDFYAERAFAPLWLDGGHPGARAKALVAALASSGSEGLDPADYHVDAIAQRFEAPAPGRQAELDLLLTDALIEYAVHLRTGRVSPGSIDREHALEPPSLDPRAIAEGAEAAADIAAYLEGFVPPDPDYAVLRDALAEYRRLAGMGGWPLAGDGPVLKPGMQDASVPALRRRLAATGEYAGTDLESEVYDGELEAAVRRFQERLGLVSDGIVGTNTRRELNISAEGRARQILANMERLRWLPDDLGARHVRVNLPSYSLQAVENGQVRLEMPVIVGSAVRQTPILKSRIGHLVYNPTWTVPETIAKKDMLPRLIEDPGSLLRDGIQIYDGWHEDAAVIDPYAVDWRQVGSRILRYRLRQEAGPSNPLGQVKFMFPNRFDVYLHDTPQRRKFDRTARALSSGCVRVGDPDALADFLFEGTPGWSPDKREALKASGRTKTVWLKRPVPVYLLYQTVIAQPGGGVLFRPDVYGRDRLLLAALGKRHATALKLAEFQEG